MHDQISFSFVLHWICLEVCHKAIFLIKKQNKENWGSFFEADVLEFIEKFPFRSEKFHKMQAKDKAEREANSPMLNCVLKYDHFENIHRYIKLN